MIPAARSHPSSLIRVEDLHKSFSSGGVSLHVLKGVSLEIRSAEILAVVGASGAGKSTLLHILGTLERPSSGRVLYEGQDPFRLSDRDLSAFRNRYVGFVFQFHHLLPEFTALENVMLPALIQGQDRSRAAHRAAELLERVGLGERLGHRPGELSGGEQQRVALARALVQAPRVVLADEPTGNLDTPTGDAVFRLIQELNRELGTTFVLVTHNERLAAKAHRVVRLVDGEVRETHPLAL